MKKQQIHYQTGQYGEMLVCNLFRGAWRARKKSFDIQVPTIENPRGHLGKLEVKTAKPSFYLDESCWQLSPPTTWQTRFSDFLVWVCLDKNYKLRRLYAIPHGNYPQSTVHLRARNQAKWEKFRII